MTISLCSASSARIKRSITSSQTPTLHSSPASPVHPLKQERRLICITELVTGELVAVRKKGSLHINKPAAVTAMAFGTMGFQQRAALQLWWLMSFGWFPMLRDAGFHILN